MTFTGLGLSRIRICTRTLRKKQINGLKIDLRSGTAERLAAEDNSMDAVVVPLFCVQCQILLVHCVLRVLKPGGRFYLSNTLLPHKKLGCDAQSGVKPIWKVLGDGC